MGDSLKKEIKFFSAFAIVMGTVIGAGVFFKSAAVTAATQSGSLTLLAWLVGGLLTICGGLTITELATAIPQTGGPVKYLEVAYGKLPGFLLGWAQGLVYYPANIAALGVIFATQLLNLFHLQQALLLPIALLAVVSITGINLLGTRITAYFQSATLILKMIPIVLIVVASLLSKSTVHFTLLPVDLPHGNWAQGFAAALLATLFAYDGWLGLGNMAGEMKRPEKDLPRAIIFGLGAVTLIYFLINWGMLKTLPLTQIAGNSNATSEAAMVLFGESGGKLVTLGILISVYGALNGYTLSGIRVPYALALEDSWPFSKQFRKLSKHTAVPYVVALFQLAVACVMMYFGNFDLLTDMVIFIMWTFNLFLFVAVFKLRKTQPNLPRPYRVPLYPVIPAIAIVGCAFILVMTLITQTKLVAIGIFLTVLGVPVYFYKNKKQTDSSS